LALPVADVVQAVGDPEDTVSAVVIPVAGEMEALVLLLIDAGTVAALHRLLGVASEDPIADSALMEAGNILIAAYLNAISVMTGLAIEPTPPELRTDLLATIVASLPVEYSDELDIALVMESELRIAEEACRMSFLLLPGPGGVSDLLSPLGLSEVGA
jgi:chemotaxis protein CheC